MDENITINKKKLNRVIAIVICLIAISLVFGGYIFAQIGLFYEAYICQFWVLPFIWIGRSVVTWGDDKK